MSEDDADRTPEEKELLEEMEEERGEEFVEEYDELILVQAERLGKL
jgi:hypothetical protein